ncbi:MAG TPA: leucyl/phenylalanyl-tRNA--protein transferase [Vicinamibacterales bacterium]|nr:leucyl/phenylalanyl-tRNA--protein transferase [Vicinamibacterales bacterium]
MIAVDVLVSAYARGWFPMAVAPGIIEWFSPDPRGIVPLETFHVPSRLARLVRKRRFEVTIDRAFGAVIRACAGRDDEDGSWIDDEIIASYEALHGRGLAHSVETWREGRLAGGLYGVSLRGAFFGESMFHHETDASKVALALLVERLRAGGYRLLDTQWVTPHLAQFGAVEIPRHDYLERLQQALRVDARFGLTVSP